MTTEFPEYKPGDFFVAEDGTRYKAADVLDLDSCTGCAGDDPGITPVCRSLPAGCSRDGIIWIKEKAA